MSGNVISTWQKVKRQVLSRPRLVRKVVLLTLLLTIVYVIGSWINPWWQRHQPAQRAQQYVEAFVRPESLLQQQDGRTNVLLLGVGGEGHEGSTLTDSVMLISVAWDGSDVSMLSLPRDLWVPSLVAKLNTAYYYGEQREENGGGLILAQAAVEEITGVPVHYAALLDFRGFVRFVDALGGIEVDVERSFVDEKFPIPGRENVYPEEDRYETIRFEAGRQSMDGITALKFARSRNAEGIEGTDLARSERQKRILAAIQRKMLATNVLLNVNKIEELYGVIESSVVTDITDEEGAAFARLATRFQQDDLRAVALPVFIDDEHSPVTEEDALIINPPLSSRYKEQWVLAPKEDYNQVHDWVACKLLQRGCVAESAG